MFVCHEIFTERWRKHFDSGVICRPKSELIFYCQSAQISLHKSQIELLQNITLLCHNFTCHESHIFCLIILFLSRGLVSMFKCYRRKMSDVIDSCVIENDCDPAMAIQSLSPSCNLAFLPHENRTII